MKIQREIVSQFFKIFVWWLLLIRMKVNSIRSHLEVLQLQHMLQEVVHSTFSLMKKLELAQEEGQDRKYCLLHMLRFCCQFMLSQSHLFDRLWLLYTTTQLVEFSKLESRTSIQKQLAFLKAWFSSSFLSPVQLDTLKQGRRQLACAHVGGRDRPNTRYLRRDSLWFRCCSSFRQGATWNCSWICLLREWRVLQLWFHSRELEVLF